MARDGGAIQHEQRQQVQAPVREVPDHGQQHGAVQHAEEALEHGRGRRQEGGGRGHDAAQHQVDEKPEFMAAAMGQRYRQRPGTGVEQGHAAHHAFPALQPRWQLGRGHGSTQVPAQLAPQPDEDAGHESHAQPPQQQRHLEGARFVPLQPDHDAGDDEGRRLGRAPRCDGQQQPLALLQFPQRLGRAAAVLRTGRHPRRASARLRARNGCAHAGARRGRPRGSARRIPPRRCPRRCFGSP